MTYKKQNHCPPELGCHFFAAVVCAFDFANADERETAGSDRQSLPPFLHEEVNIYVTRFHQNLQTR